MAKACTTGYVARIAAGLRALNIADNYATEHRLQLQPEATELVTARVLPDGRELKLAPTAATAWTSMFGAAARENVALRLISGFRSVDHQRKIVERKLAKGQSLAEILRVNCAHECSHGDCKKNPALTPFIFMHAS